MAHPRSDLALGNLAKQYGEIYRIKVGVKETGSKQIHKMDLIFK